MSEEQTASRDLIAIARRNAERADSVLQKRLAREKRNEQMAVDYNGNNGLSVTKLAEKYGVTDETVRQGLRAEGVYAPKPRARITDDVRDSVKQMLTQGATVQQAAAAAGVSVPSVRNIGLAAGVLAKGSRRAKRSEQEWAAIKILDDGCREQFGTGLLSLGSALRAHEKAAQPQESESPNVAAAPEPSDDDDKPW